MNKPKGVRKAVILAAGRSRRLEKLNLEIPKPLIEVAGRPLLGHHLEACAACGVEDVYINLYYLPQLIRDFAGDGSRWGLRIHYHLESELMGTAGGARGFSEDLRGESFLVIYGDNYCTFSLEEILQGHFNSRLKPDMSMMLFSLEDVSGSGVAICGEDQIVQSFVEKPRPGETSSHWVNAGVYLLEPGLLDLIPEGPSDFGHDVIPRYLRAGKRLLGVKTQGRVIAVDTPELLRRATS